MRVAVIDKEGENEWCGGHYTSGHGMNYEMR